MKSYFKSPEIFRHECYFHLVWVHVQVKPMTLAMSAWGRITGMELEGKSSWDVKVSDP